MFRTGAKIYLGKKTYFGVRCTLRLKRRDNLSRCLLNIPKGVKVNEFYNSLDFLSKQIDYYMLNGAT